MPSLLTWVICLTLRCKYLPVKVSPLSWSHVMMDGKELDDNWYQCYQWCRSSVSNGSTFGTSRFYRSVWQWPCNIKNWRFFMQTVQLSPPIYIRQYRAWYLKYASLHGVSFAGLRFFDMFETHQVVALLHCFQTKNDCIFNAACWVLKISNIGDHQKMRHAKLNISHTKL